MRAGASLRYLARWDSRAENRSPDRNPASKLHRQAVKASRASRSSNTRKAATFEGPSGMWSTFFHLPPVSGHTSNPKRASIPPSDAAHRGAQVFSRGAGRVTFLERDRPGQHSKVRQPVKRS